MYPETLPNETVRALGSIVLYLCDLALGATRNATARLLPLVEPPAGLKLVSPQGIVYSGLILVEGGVCVAGIVVEVARSFVAPHLEPQYRAPLVTPPPRYESRAAHLPNWADDPRDLLDDEEERERWRRR
jgi:hypothetical protein